MIVALWVLNAVLALFFLYSGATKIFRSKTALAASGLHWVDDFSAVSVRLIGVVEVLGAAGLILPILVNVVPILAPVAAIGLTIVMIGGTIVHVRRHERPLPAAPVAVLTTASAIVGFLALA
ncbi:DoxX family protein [Microbacterium sp. RD1]|uniref:DoxX family protein n=1 Tax=Microbacterium sp. RD1 TaxID=3457313 RepID=UPI003FA53E51